VTANARFARLVHPGSVPAAHVARVALAVGAAAVIALLLVWSVGVPAELVRGIGGADFGDLGRRLIGAAAWLCWGWLALLMALELVAAAPGPGAWLAASALRRMSPGALRVIAQAVLGISLVAGPLAAAPAFAAGDDPVGSPSPSAVASPGLPQQLSLPPQPPQPALLQQPSLDRPIATSTASSAAVSTPTQDGRPSLDRPVTSRYIAPEPPRRPLKTADPGVAVLMSGTANRGTTDDGYTVRRGDALWDIAARHLGPQASAAEIARAWPRWYAANRHVIGADPDLLMPGEVLYAPSN
jgi:hypothetical protein